MRLLPAGGLNKVVFPFGGVGGRFGDHGRDYIFIGPFPLSNTG